MALAPSAPAAAAAASAVKKAPAAPKSGRIMPAVPMLSPAAKPRAPVNSVAQPNQVNATVAAIAASQLEAPQPLQPQAKPLEDANRDARAAVAAAMAKLPAPGPKKQPNGESAMDNLTNKVNEMRTNDNIRTSRQAGASAYVAGNRGGRGGFRGGRPRTDSRTKKIEVPKTDYDFASANAKFNKQDLVKEAIASGSPLGSPVSGSHDASTDIAAVTGSRRESEQSISGPTVYNKTSSFFDNISSESKDRDDSKKLGGREFRTEEQKKNLETFGQGSVDNNYRGGYRGRGRGRGFRGGRGPRSGRGGMRARDTVAAES